MTENSCQYLGCNERDELKKRIAELICFEGRCINQQNYITELESKLSIATKMLDSHMGKERRLAEEVEKILMKEIDAKQEYIAKLEAELSPLKEQISKITKQLDDWSGFMYAHGYGWDQAEKNINQPKITELSYSAPSRIISNKAKCAKCGDIIESKTVHDFVTCSCGAISVDGGKEYCKRSAMNFEDLIEMSEYE